MIYIYLFSRLKRLLYFLFLPSIRKCKILFDNATTCNCIYSVWLHENKKAQPPFINEGCSNMNASSFITFLTYIQQNDKRFYKELYVTKPKEKYSILIEL